MPERASDLWWLFTRQTVCVNQNESLIEAAELMYDRNFRHLPIVSQSSKIIGIISAQDIVDSLHLVLRSYSSREEVSESLDLAVEKIMSPGIIAVEPGDGLEQIVRKLAYHNIGALPVVNEQGTVQGIITLRDLVALIGMSSNPIATLVSEIMNTKITTIALNDPFTTAVGLMSEKRVRRLPVMRSNKDNFKELEGVLTNKDVLRYILEITGRKKADFERSARMTDHQAPFDIPVSELATRNAIMISQDDDLRVAASRMMIFGVGGLVIENAPGEKIALVTERDLIRTLSIRKSANFLVDAMRYESETVKKI